MLRRVWDRVPEYLVWLASLLVLLMMLHVSLDVALKYLFNRPVPATVEVVSYYYMVAAVFLPVAWSEKVGAGITVDLFLLRAPRWLRLGAACLALLMTAGAYLLLTVNTFEKAVQAFHEREVVMGPLMLPTWPSRFILPLSFLIASGICLVQLWHILTRPAARTAAATIAHAPQESADVQH